MHRLLCAFACIERRCRARVCGLVLHDDQRATTLTVTNWWYTLVYHVSVLQVARTLRLSFFFTCISLWLRTARGWERKNSRVWGFSCDLPKSQKPRWSTKQPATRLMPNGVICDTRNLEAKGYGFITPDAGKTCAGGTFISKCPHRQHTTHKHTVFMPTSSSPFTRMLAASLFLSRSVPPPCLSDSRSEKGLSAMQVGTTCTLT